MDCNTYFLSSVALQIWQRNDEDGQNRMLTCLSQVHKEGFFRRVIYKNRYSDSVNNELAENAFLMAWESFNINGKAGKISLTEKQYTGYFYIAFKRTYLKLVGTELKKHGAEKEFSLMGDSSYDAIMENEQVVRERVQRTLQKMGANCRKMLEWKFMEGASHDVIAQRRNITRKSSINTLFRCVAEFKRYWDNSGN
jgi:DNA-directed RNA polymerase specialized sigma24 family protein